MPYPSTYPIIYNECLQLTIYDLKRLGYLHAEKQKAGNLMWWRGSTQIAKIHITSVLSSDKRYLHLSYACNGEARNYTIEITSLRSNLGKGCVNYFLCPQTNKRCRNLYLNNGYFVHRKAFKGLYEVQVRSSGTRAMIQYIEYAHALDEAYMKLYSKRLRKFYSGKPTKRYLSLVRTIKQLENEEDIFFDLLPSSI
jgi:hypothetical protein